MICSDRFLSSFAFVSLAVLMFGCASSPRFTRGNDTQRPSASSPRSASTVAPSNGNALLTLEGVASFYAHDFHGRKTSNGETYDMHGLTAAHRTFPFGTRIMVTNLANGRTTVVRVNDRGPFHSDRISDLALGAARELGFEKEGTAKVKLEVMEWREGK